MSGWPSATVLFSPTSHLLTRPACSATMGICIFMASMMPTSVSTSTRSPTLTRQVMRCPDTGEETLHDTRLGSAQFFACAQEHVCRRSARRGRVAAARSCTAVLRQRKATTSQKKKREPSGPPLRVRSEEAEENSSRYVFIARIAQHVAPTPNRLDIVLPPRRRLQLLAQFTDEDVDDLELGLVHAAVEVVEEHFLGQGGALAQREQLQHLVFFAGQVHALIVHLDRLGIEIDLEFAGLDDRLGVALGAAHDGMDAGHQLVLVEGLGHVVVGAEAEAAHLVLDACKPR